MPVSTCKVCDVKTVDKANIDRLSPNVGNRHCFLRNMHSVLHVSLQTTKHHLVSGD